MPYQFIPYTVFLMASAIMTLALAVYGIKHRHTFGTKILGLCMAIGTLWSCANALELSAMTLEHKLFWANLQYIAYSLGPVAWFLTSCHFTGRAHWFTRKRTLILLVVPAITILLVWTDPWWGLVRTGFRLEKAGVFLLIAKEYGPWFWVHVAQSYSLNFLSMFLLTQVVTEKTSIYRRQAFFLFAGVSLVVFANVLYVLGISPVPGLDVTPLVFSLSAGLMFWGIYSCDLFRIVPIAWEKVIEAMETAVVVVGNDGRVVEANPAFCRLFAQEQGASPLGIALASISAELAHLSSRNLPNVGKHLEMRCSGEGGDRFYEVFVSEIRDHRAYVQGKAIAINDITELKVAQEKLSMEQQELAVAAERIRFTQDLHDNLGQVLGFCSLQVQSIGRELERGNTDQAATYLRRLGTVLGEAQHEMRSYVHGMRTREYEQTSLAVLVTREVTRLKENQHYDVHLDIAPSRFSVETKTQLCSIVKEALNNIRKHSGADFVEISLQPRCENWVLAITDNGIGFDPTSTLEFNRSASGLSIMAERAHLLGGELQIDSCTSKTVIRVEFPQKGD